MKLLLIGVGNMGEAMIEGLQTFDLSIVCRSNEKANKLKKKYTNIIIFDSTPNLDEYTVILAIKPSSFESFTTYGKAKGLISVMAGVKISKLKDKIDAHSYVRAMPNMAAMFKRSATSLCGDESLKEEAIKVINSIGKSFWLDSEDELNIATGLAGSSPAWLAIVAEGLSDGAVNLGLKRDISYDFLSELFIGMGMLLKEEHPAIIKDKVCSPKGTTIAGVKELEKGRVRNTFMNAMIASYARAKK